MNAKTFPDLDNFDKRFLEKKAWGWKYNVYSDNNIAVDVCWAYKGGHCSWHFHEHQYNAFLVLDGKLKVIREYSPESSSIVEEMLGTTEKTRKIMVYPLHKHKFIAYENTLFVEVATVRYQKEDIIRSKEDLGGLLQAAQLESFVPKYE